MKSQLKRPNYQRVIKTAEKFFVQSNIRPSPPINIERAVRNLGITIIQNELEGDVSGYLFVSKDCQPIIGVNSKHPEVRRRFTIAHELGHFCLHVAGNSEISFVDKNFLIINRDSRSELGIEIEEIEANFFAAEVLMPAVSLYRNLASYGPIDSDKIYEKLGKEYNVSKDAIHFRLNFLGFLRI